MQSIAWLAAVLFGSSILAAQNAPPVTPTQATPTQATPTQATPTQAIPGPAAGSLETNGRVDEPVDLKILFLGDQGHHQPKLRFESLAPRLAERGIRLEYTESLEALRLDRLRQFDALIIYANIDVIDAAAEHGLLTYVREGGGLVALHCASYCFRNSRDVVAMIGAQFEKHGTGVFRTTPADPAHPLLRGFAGFESWDETYVHRMHNEQDRTVLEYRTDDQGREPWTWIRNEGSGRVFYTAWGHDERTWTNPGFENLVERGVRWAAGRDPAEAGPYLREREFPNPSMTVLPDYLSPFEYEDVGKQIPNYTPSRQWGVQGEPFNLMQQPLAAVESMRHYVTPAGFHLELFAAEPDLQGKPIFMNWDEQGRLWICETVDYPNELQPAGSGRDRIRICSDTDGDCLADRFVVFAEGLSIPAALTFYRGGVIVQNGTETVYLRDLDGDDRADERTVWFRGWNQSDTHGGVSHFQYGFDNWIWAMQGYNHSQPSSDSGKFPGGFAQGFFRFHPETREIEFLRATNNNTWGLGMTEDGLIFGSTANGNPSVFLPIPNRYYEQVAGWRASLTLSSIADSNRFQPITERVRQVDHHGGYTAAAGHAIYTARNYPREYWNQTAFVCEPTGHLVGTFLLKPDGAGFRSTNPFNLIASDDEWAAPIMAEVGPDGNVWVIDWYNFIVQHNPTPEGFATGRGAAYESKLRDKVRGRIYRIVPDNARHPQPFSLADATTSQLVETLKHPTLLWRRHAQRLIVERGDLSALPQLIQQVSDRQIDEVGLNVGVIHALWTLQGLKVIEASHPEVLQACESALRHASAGVRRNALQVLPPSDRTTAAVLAERLLQDADPQVRLQAFLTLADAAPDSAAARAIADALFHPGNYRDPHLRDAATSAAARQGIDFLLHAAQRQSIPRQSIPRQSVPRQSVPPEILAVLTPVAEHLARSASPTAESLATLIQALANSDPAAAGSVLRGFVAGWTSNQSLPENRALDDALESLAQHLDARDLSSLLQFADRIGSRRLDSYAHQVTAGLLQQLDDSSKPETERIAAARQLVDFRPADPETLKSIVSRVTPQTEPALASGWIRTLAGLQIDSAGAQIANELERWSPTVRRQALETLLARRNWTTAVVDLLDQGQLQIGDLSLEQRTALAAHPDPEIRQRALEILDRGGAKPNANRQAVLDEYHAATQNTGNAVAGQKIFTDVCAKCHRHSGQGQSIGPDLTGMAVHPKSELLVHILDPSRSVENNFRMYQVQTLDGLTLSGMLGSESRTTIELIDSQGQRRTLLREEVEELRGSKLSVMPEGIEKEINTAQMTDLLEFLTAHGTWLPLDLGKVATVASDRGMFYDRNADAERLIFPEWKEQSFRDIPFQLIDPQDGQQPNAIVLRGPANTLTANLPATVELPVNTTARAFHFLSGVSGWGFPYHPDSSVSMIARLHYENGETEDHELRNAEHFADYIRRVDVPKSEFAFKLRGQQLRYFAIVPTRDLNIARLELIKGPDPTAPVVMAITVETR